MSIKIEMLRCFRAVVEQGNLNNAAATLNRTASAVSMTLKQFEEHIGAHLFETSRKSRLTPLGEQVYAEAVKELDHFQRTTNTIEGLSRSELGHVRLAVSGSLSQFVPEQILDSYLRKHPGVKLDARELTGADVRAALEAEEIDIGIGPIEPMPGFDRQLLFTDGYGIICQTDHPLVRKGPEVTWADVEGYEFIANPICHQVRCVNSAALIDSARMTVFSSASLHDLIATGHGVSMLSERSVLAGYKTLKFLPLKNASRRREVYIVTPPHPILIPAARELADAIRSIAVPEAL